MKHSLLADAKYYLFKTMVKMKMTVFWDVVACSLAETDQCFTGAYFLHHQGTTSQKMSISILATVRTCNFTNGKNK
jgi:hypothetical protein